MNKYNLKITENLAILIKQEYNLNIIIIKVYISLNSIIFLKDFLRRLGEIRKMRRIKNLYLMRL